MKPIIVLTLTTEAWDRADTGVFFEIQSTGANLVDLKMWSLRRYTQNVTT